MSIAKTFSQKMRKSIRDARYRAKHHDRILAKQRRARGV